MSVTIRPDRGGGWELDIRVGSPDGTRHKRERKHAPISSRTVVGRWAAARERVLFERLLSRQRTTHARRCPRYKNSRRASSTATHGRIDRSRAGLHRRP
jgi:hypothetical protein